MLEVFLRLRDAMSRPHTRLILGVALFAFAVFLFALPVLAETPPAPGASEPGFFSDPAGVTMELVGKLFLWVAQIALSITVAMLDVLIELLTYNGFGTSQVVAVGWAVVRDVVNLFFVVVLIIIAFGTILGVSRFNWIQQVPRLLIFAIVINFSKTLASLMIDIGQVITLTFANALKDIAAGNFIQLFGINEIFSISVSSDPVAKATTPGAEGIQGFDLMASGLAAAALAIWITIVVFIMLLIFALRIVMLWVLIILAPLAWFIGGIKDVVHSKAYDTWWAKFTCWVAIGPVLTFFLWLALAVAGSGNIAVTEGMASGDGGGASNLILSIFESHRLMSFVLGMAMIMAGFEAAQEICSSAGGFISSALKGARTAAIGAIGGYAAGRALKGGGELALKGAKYGAKAPFKLAWGGAKLVGGRPVRAIGAGIAAVPGLRWATKKGRAQQARKFAKWTGSTTLAGVAAKIADSAEAGRRKDMAESIEGFDTRASKTEYLNTFAKKGGKGFFKGGPSALQKKRATAMLQQVMGDDDALEELEASGALPELWKKFGGDKLKKEFSGDADMLEKIEDFEKKHVNISGKTDKINDWDKVKKMSDRSFQQFGQDEELQKQLQGINSGVKGKNGDFDSAGRNINDLIDTRVQDGDTRDRSVIREDLIESGEFDGEFLSADQAIRGGHGVGAKKAKLYRGDKALLEGMRQEELSKMTDDQIAANIGKDSAKSPELAVRAMRTGNTRLKDDPDLYKNLLTSALGIKEDGTVDDKKMAQNMKENSGILVSVKEETVQAHKSDLAKNFDANSLTKAIAQIKKDPKSAASQALHRNISIILEAKGDKKMQKNFANKLQVEFPDVKRRFEAGGAPQRQEIEQLDSAMRNFEAALGNTMRRTEARDPGARRSAAHLEERANALLTQLATMQTRSTNEDEIAHWDDEREFINRRLAHVQERITELGLDEESDDDVDGGAGGAAT